MPYQGTANRIIRESIKSAVFIDENALPYNTQGSDPLKYEEKLSVELYNNFKNNGISLAIHKFQNGNENNLDLKRYLFEARDLVLLDWKLDGEQGEEYSLKMLVDIINNEHIHFCVIYTAETNLDNIYANIISYFSGKDKEFYDLLKEKFDAEEDILSPIFKQFNLFDNNLNRKLIPEIRTLGDDLMVKINSIDKNIFESFKQLTIAFSNYHKSDEPLFNFKLGSFENKTIVINNTIIALVNKETDDAESDANNIIEKFSGPITRSPQSYTHLLGLEMQSLFFKNSAFIDSNFINVSKKTISYHRKQLMDDSESDAPFREIMKKVFLEHANLKLSTSDLSILDPAIFENEPEEGTPNEKEAISINVFYNSLKLDTENKKLDFGDVFKTGEDEFFICITALCDCIRPSKTDFIFYFAKGQSISLSKAMQLADSAFISFISNEKAVVWSNIDVLNSKTKEEKMEELDQYRYKPIFIKPITYLVQNPTFSDGSIELARIYQYPKKNGDLEFIKVDYVTTIKPNYAQRIANHAFTHPVRIGVDFLKKN